MATRYRFGVEEFERLFQGVKHLELLEGEIYEMSPIGPRHVFAVAQLDKRLQALLGEEAVIAVQSPLRLSPDSEPEPDLQVLRPPQEEYSERLPEAKDILTPYRGGRSQPGPRPEEAQPLCESRHP